MPEPSLPAIHLALSTQFLAPAAASRWKTILRPYGQTLRAICQAVLQDTRLSGIPCRWEITVVLADDAAIRALNRDYRGHDKPTNVLSFPAHEHFEKIAHATTEGLSSYHIGDIILALETLEREALEQKKAVRDHTTHLLAHGLLHLLGYDHEDTLQAETMEAKEIKILKKLQVENPYL